MTPEEIAALVAKLDRLMEAALDECIAADSAVPDDAHADLQLDATDPPVWARDVSAEAQRARDRFEMRNVKIEYGGI